MSILEIIGKIIIPVLVGVAILGSLQSIKTTSLDPKVDETESVLDQVGTTTFNVGEDGVSESTARKQMEGLVVWNALASSDCRLLTGAHMMMQMKVEKLDGDRVLQFSDGQDSINNWVTGSGDRPEMENENKNGYIGFSSFYEPLISKGFEKQCVGTSNVISEMKEEMEDASSGLLGGLGDAFGKLVAVTSGAAFLIGCGATAPICVGGGIAVAVIVDQTYGTAAEYAGELSGKLIVPGSWNDFHNDAGFDMEGKFGRIGFNVSQTFEFGPRDRYKPIFGIGIKIKGGNGNTPGFWQGRRFLYAVPAGLNPGGINDKWHRISHNNMDFESNDDYQGFGDNKAQIRKFYAFRLRMMNVPIIANQEIDEDALTDTCGSSCSNKVKEVRNFIDKTRYLFCEGAQGYIQSNSKRMHKTGEVTGTDSYKEDQVYPYVKIEDGATACLNPPDGEQRNPSNVYRDDVSLSCDEIDDMGVEETKIFERPTADEGEMVVKLICGGEEDQFSFPSYGTDDRSDYGQPYTYWRPQSYQTGCGGNQDYNLTEDATELDGAGNDMRWRHEHDRDYGDGDSIEESKHQITYRNFRVKYRNNNTDNKTFVIETTGDVSDPGGDVTFNRRFVIEDANIGGSKRYTVNIYEGSEDNPSLMESETYETSPPGDTNTIKIMRTPATGFPEVEVKIGDELLIEDVWLGYLGSSDPDYELKRLEARTLTSTDIGKYNDETSNEISATQKELEIQEVLTNGKPRVCNTP